MLKLHYFLVHKLRLLVLFVFILKLHPILLYIPPNGLSKMEIISLRLGQVQWWAKFFNRGGAQSLSNSRGGPEL
jgi:hypothetical protein